MNDILNTFNDKGRQASFHYADDSGKEWGHAKRLETDCRRLFAEHPELQDEMTKIAKGFLWTL
jgi:hypothetical protein